MTTHQPAVASEHPGSARSLLGDVEGQLRELLQALEPAPYAWPPPGRPRVLPTLCLWGGMLVCVLRGFSSQLAIWRLLAQTGLWDYPRLAISDQAIYHRLARDGAAPLAHLFQQVTTLLATRLEPLLPSLVPPLATFASDIVVLDETTLDAVARRLPADSDRPSGAPVLAGKLAGVFDVRRQSWRTIQYQPNPVHNERVAARSLVADLTPGTLLLFDLGYFGFAWLDELTAQRQWWVTRMRAKTSYTIIHIFAQHGDTLDALVWLGAYRADQAAYPVRLVQVRHGQQLQRYLTNVHNPAQLPLAEVLALYARRWDIEMAIQLVKQHLGLRLLWSCKPVVIEQQIWAVLIIAQIVQALRLEIAARAGVEVFEVSLPLLVRYLPEFARRGEDPVRAIVERGRAAGFIRPARRIRMRSPDPPLAVAWSLGPIPVFRTPRYAGKQ